MTLKSRTWPSLLVEGERVVGMATLDDLLLDEAAPLKAFSVA